MKYFFGSALLTLAALSAQAQTTQGTKLLGGSLGFHSANTETTSQLIGTPLGQTKSTARGGAVSLNGGYFVRDGWAVGLGVGLGGSSNEQPHYAYDGSGGLAVFQGSSKQSSVSVAPFVRYYHLLGEKAGFFGQFSVGYGQQRASAESTAPGFVAHPIKTKTGYASLTPGFVYFPSSKIGLEVSLGNLGYSRGTSRTEDPLGANTSKSTSSGFNAMFGISSLHLGASLYLGH
ncbi:hypothetical protein [Hymenobacter latericus]|uniref:hypothetical protein n=1 Tax=Hymenobacter sp. YIM 151858-1 TaxID=2987688 RepID=UPI002227FF43|nr:hypothetical protein [Hymenobacter sp. YIM 151858-1]UYZ58459.1 hypothetical protein OIS50_15505 [Hymenobacter sp. YIM 151858-1]